MKKELYKVYQNRHYHETKVERPKDRPKEEKHKVGRPKK